MPQSVKTLLADANQAVPRIAPAEARAMLESGEAIAVDVRDAPELAKTGKVPGAVHVPRGMLEFRADPETPYYDANLRKDRTLILYCASGGRSALAGRTLKEFGYDKVLNMGGFKDWAEAGLPVEGGES